jgi:hypothetical protein
MSLKFWTASGILGVASAFMLGIVEYATYRRSNIRIDDNGELATLGLVFLSSIALRIIRDAIQEKPQTPNDNDTENNPKAR